MDNLNAFFSRMSEMEQEHGVDYIASNPVMEQLAGREVIIYGAGAVGHEIYEELCKQNITVKYFCSGLNGGYVDQTTGISVITKEELKGHRESCVIIAIGDAATEAEKEQLMFDIAQMGIAKKCIFKASRFGEKVSASMLLSHKEEISSVYRLLEDECSRKTYLKKLVHMVEFVTVDYMSHGDMYVEEGIISGNSSEVVIDGGAFDGDTAELFLKYFGPDTEVYSFEPDKKNYEKLLKRVNGRKSITMVNAGLWSSEGWIGFDGDQNGSSTINSNSENAIRVVSLDAYCAENNIAPTFIKMDIEGAEYEALMGAKQVIGQNYPKLAICIYHKPQDIYELPLLLHKLGPDYKMFVRHYSDRRVDTVLYCLKK